MALETSPEHPAPVRQVNQAIASWIGRLGAIWVEGQVTQVSRRGGSNTVFLTLRDKLADVSVSVTAPRGVIDALPTPLVEGAQVVCHAKPDFYAPRGSMSLQVREVRLVGEGELLARLERRRRLLAAEGLFAPELKRPLPFLPGAVGLVTGEGSAAERDVVEVARRRWPGVRLVVRHAAMQGVHAAREVVEALQGLDRDPQVQVIVIARGGGSVEDLLPFSDEALVRAVHAVRTPVVSAIGHEPDSPILDLVADLRAATPTDAAKRVVPDVAEEVARVAQLRQRARRAVRHGVEREQALLDSLRSRPSLADPRDGLRQRLDEVHDLRDRARRSLARRVERAEHDLHHHLARVRALSPLATLRRGYAVISDESGQARSSVEGLRAGAPLHVRVADGRIATTVTGVEQVALIGEDDDDE
ncbi:exodeoxyribonuclease VII large subunit [Nocardioides aequoreus]|uniref:exodeoxyribonuclease VII large subunit n=1 Tax=Nocardioides aequoreus TaxID=397278 RepID=UPI0004C41885|nr:exodeoxyribonuclease VII large subunit [Nocardioides aequoreus]